MGEHGDSLAAARAIYHSGAYQAVIGDRLAATTPRTSLIVETIND